MRLSTTMGPHVVSLKSSKSPAKTKLMINPSVISGYQLEKIKPAGATHSNANTNTNMGFIGKCQQNQLCVQH